MRRVVASGAGVELEEVGRPHPPEGCVLVRSCCTLISPGTELHYIRRAKLTGIRQPLGYCAAGVVEALGNRVEELQTGDCVVAMGWGYALHADYIIVPQRLCAKISDTVPHEQAVFSALACTAFHALDRAGEVDGNTVLVVGAGLVGQLVTRTAQLRGARVGIVDLIGARARHANADFVVPHESDEWARHLPTPVDKVIFTAASAAADAAFANSVRALRQEPNGRPIGRIVMVGRCDVQLGFSVELGNVDICNSAHAGFGYRDDEYVRGIKSYPAPAGQNLVDINLRNALAAVASGALDVSTIHTHRLSILKAPEAYRLLQESSSTALGVTLHYD